MKSMLVRERALPSTVANAWCWCMLLIATLVAPILICADPPQELDGGPRWFLIVEDSMVDPTTNEAPHRYKLKIIKSIGKQNRILLDRALPAARAKSIESILRTIVKEFHLSPLDEKGQIAESSEPSAQVIFFIRQLTNNRRKDIWFDREEAERLKLQAALDKLIVITNEQIGPKPTHQELREFQQALEMRDR